MHAYLIVPLQQLPYTRMPDSWCTCRLLQCVAVCLSVLQQLQCATVCCTGCTIRAIQMFFPPTLFKCGAESCWIVQCVAVCCSVLQCATVCCSVLQSATVCYSVLQRVATVATYVYVWHICKTPFLNNTHTADPETDLQAEAKHSKHTEKTFLNTRL